MLTITVKQGDRTLLHQENCTGAPKRLMGLLVEMPSGDDIAAVVRTETHALEFKLRAPVDIRELALAANNVIPKARKAKGTTETEA